MPSWGRGLGCGRSPDRNVPVRCPATGYRSPHDGERRAQGHANERTHPLLPEDQPARPTPASSRPSCCPSRAPIPTRPRAPSTASPSRPRTWWPTRAPPTIPGSTARSIGTQTLALPRIPVGPRPRRRRSHGHRPARHGPRLADLARADHARREGRQGLGGAQRPPGADRLGLRHRPSRSRQRALHRRGDPRLRGADGGDREGRRPPHRHGEPRARPRRQVAGRLRARL